MQEPDQADTQVQVMIVSLDLTRVAFCSYPVGPGKLYMPAPLWGTQLRSARQLVYSVFPAAAAQALLTTAVSL